MERCHHVVNAILAVSLLILAAAAGELAGQTPPSEQTGASRQMLAASPRHMEFVQVPVANGDPVRAFVVHPERRDAADSVVIIHTVLAMTDWIRVVADELAKHGYVAIVPDLLTGHGPGGGDTDSFASNVAHRVGIPATLEASGDVTQAMGRVDKDEITARLRAAVQYVRELPSTTNTVSVVGFCWGGTEAFRLATNEPSLSKTVVFYGTPPAAADMARITSPVYGFYGENDFRVNATIEDAKKAMAAAGKTYEPVIYGGVGHGFMQAGMGDRTVSDPEGDRLAKLRTKEAVDRLLKLLQ